MSKLPGVEELAILVSQVTGGMLGATFVPADRMIRGESICEQMAMIVVAADPKITVVLSVDAEAGQNLGAALLGLTGQDITARMIDEAVADLLTKVAARIAEYLGVDQPLGIPQRTTLGELVRVHGTLDFDEAILLRSRGDLDIGLWILEERSGNKARPRDSSASGGLLRFLLRTIGPRRPQRSAGILEVTGPLRRWGDDHLPARRRMA